MSLLEAYVLHMTGRAHRGIGTSSTQVATELRLVVRSATKAISRRLEVYIRRAMRLFRFLDDEEFAKLDVRERTGYLFRAHQELIERQRILREQMRKTVGVDREGTIPIRPPVLPRSERETDWDK